MPQRFFVQIDKNNIHMLIIPRSFHAVLLGWLLTPLPCCIPMLACKFYDEWVEVSMHVNMVVLGRNWRRFYFRYNLKEHDDVVFKLTVTGLKLRIYKSGTCMEESFRCALHG